MDKKELKGGGKEIDTLLKEKKERNGTKVDSQINAHNKIASSMHHLSKLGGCIKTGIELLRSPDISCREHRKVINELDRVSTILGEVIKNSSLEVELLARRING